MARPRKQPKKYIFSRVSETSSAGGKESSSPVPAGTKYLSSQPEARCTQNKPSYGESRDLRTEQVDFISTGSLGSDCNGLATSVQGWSSFAHRCSAAVDSVIAHVEQEQTDAAVDSACAAHQSAHRRKFASQQVDSSGESSSEQGQSTVFLQKQHSDQSREYRTAALRTASPAPSISSSTEEILFRGRCNMSSLVIDSRCDMADCKKPSRSNINGQPQTGHSTSGKTNSSLNIFEGEDLEVHDFAAECASRNHLLRSANETNRLSLGSYRDHGLDWVHRSKPGVGWQTPQGRMKKKRRAPRFITSEEEEAAIQDYIENMAEYDEGGAGNVAHPTPRDLDLSDGQARAHHSKTELNHTTTNTSSKRTDELSMFHNQGDVAQKSQDDGDWTEISCDEEMDDDTQQYDDERLARLLQMQEQIGIRSQWRQVYDGAAEDSEDFDPNDDRFPDGDISGKITIASLQETTQNAPKSVVPPPGTSGFPSASAFADAVEQDPYNGFDIMDFDRPSLRKKNKGHRDFGLSDEETQAHLQSTWQRDRERKKQRREEREKARALGLLGGKATKGISKDKPGQGISLNEAKTEILRFMNSTSNTLVLPPMDKFSRKVIHTVAGKLGVRTKSKGSGIVRHITLRKTNRTVTFNEEEFEEVVKEVRMGAPATAGKKGKKRDTSNPVSFRYREGDIVGGSAPEIGTENRGHSMLMKMGWTVGTALGSGENTGILTPLNHVVKNSRAGLG